PIPRPGEVQAQDPDDATADGADMIAAERYAVMSFWRAAEPQEEPEPTPRSHDVAGEEFFRRERERYEREQRKQERAARRMLAQMRRAAKERPKKYRP